LEKVAQGKAGRKEMVNPWGTGTEKEEVFHVKVPRINAGGLRKGRTSQKANFMTYILLKERLKRKRERGKRCTF